MIFVVATALLASSPARAGEELLFGPPPEWVEPLPVAPDPEDQSSLPVRLLRLDLQTRMEGGRQTTYSATTLKIQTPQGLDAGNLSLPWRPETDDLKIHRITIRRGTETIDVLANGQTFTTLRREQNLEMAMLDGVLTANMFPEDLQVGDILEVVTSMTSSDPVFPGHSEEILGPFNLPLDRLHVRLMWPESSHMRLVKTDDLPAWRRSNQGGYEVAELELENLEPVALPREAPLRYSMVRYIQASDFGSWSDLAAMQAPYYVKAAQVPAEGPLRTEIERIRQSSPDPVKQAEAALQLVQRRVRYVALAMGEGGYVPADATQTWARRYGDCKGKTALLLAILGELGIEAEGVLVNSVWGDTLPSRLPSVGAFDHVLVRARIGGREYWLDGTRSGDTTLAGLTIPYFHWGLPLHTRRAELVAMTPAPLTEPISDIAIHMDASDGVRAPVPSSIELVLRGDDAVDTNLILAGQVGEARDRALREYWRRRFNFIEPDSVGLAFDEGARELRLTLVGKATLEWNSGWYETDETGVGYNADFSREPGPNSDAPFVTGHPFFKRTRQTIVLPPGFTGASPDNDAVDETVAGVEYRRAARVTGNSFFVESTVRSVAPEFASRDAPAAQKRLREMADDEVYLRIPDTYPPTEADVAAILANPGEDAVELVSQGIDLMLAGRNDEALALFDKVIELDPQNAMAWADRGMAFLNKGMTDEAAASLERAAAIDPREVGIFNVRGRMAEDRNDHQAAIDAFSQALEIDPTNVFALSYRARAYAATNQDGLALADIDTTLKLDPRETATHGLRAFIHKRADRGDLAEAAIEQMIAMDPESQETLELAAGAYFSLGMSDKARPLIERAMAVNPTARIYQLRSHARDESDRPGRLADLDKALELDPKFEPALYDRADLRFRTDRYDEALADTESALKIRPGWPEVNLLRANIFTRMGRRDDALAEAAAVVADNPDVAWAHAAAGKIYNQFGLRKEALAALDRAIEMESEVVGYFIDRSQVREFSDWDGRLADIEHAIRLEPAAHYLANKGHLLYQKGDFEGARAAYSQALEKEVDSWSYLVERGIALWRLDRKDEAEADFAQARGLATDAIALNSICYRKAYTGVALERALEECEESLRLLPNHSGVLDSRGTVLLRLGRLDEAIRDFDQALEQSPGMAPSLYLRAVARTRKGEFGGVRADVVAARANAPDRIDDLERHGFVLATEPGS